MSSPPVARARWSTSPLADAGPELVAALRHPRLGAAREPRRRPRPAAGGHRAVPRVLRPAGRGEGAGAVGRHGPVVRLAAGLRGCRGAHRRPGAGPRRALRVPGARHLRPLARASGRLPLRRGPTTTPPPATSPRRSCASPPRSSSSPDDLPGWTDGQFANLVANHYLPQPEPPLPGQTRVGSHTDRGGITLLTADEAPGGLEVRPTGRGWTPVVIPDDAYVVQVGDLFSRWTNRRSRPTSTAS